MSLVTLLYLFFLFHYFPFVRLVSLVILVPLVPLVQQCHRSRILKMSEIYREMSHVQELHPQVRVRVKDKDTRISSLISGRKTKVDGDTAFP